MMNLIEIRLLISFTVTIYYFKQYRYIRTSKY